VDRFRAWPLYVLIFADLLGFGMLVVDIQLRAKSMGASPPAIGFILAATFLVQSFISPFWGRLSDRIGHKPVIITCTALSACSMAIYGFAPSLAWIIASRILSGFGFANVSAAQAYVANQTTAEMKLEVMGRISATISSGLIIGSVVGGELATWGGNQAVGFVGCLSSVVGIFAVALYLPHVAPHVAEAKQKSRRSLALLGEINALRVLVPVVVVAWFALALLEGTFAQLIQVQLGFGQREFCRVFGFESVVAVATQSFAMKWLGRVISDRFLLPISFLFQAAGIFLFPFATGMVSLLTASALYAPGSAVSQPSLNSICSNITPSERQGELFGLLQSARSVGFAVGPILGGIALSYSVRLPYFIASAGCLIAAFALLFVVGRLSVVPKPIPDSAPA